MVTQVQRVSRHVLKTNTRTLTGQSKARDAGAKMQTLKILTCYLSTLSSHTPRPSLEDSRQALPLGGPLLGDSFYYFILRQFLCVALAVLELAL